VEIEIFDVHIGGSHAAVLCWSTPRCGSNSHTAVLLILQTLRASGGVGQQHPRHDHTKCLSVAHAWCVLPQLQTQQSQGSASLDVLHATWDVVIQHCTMLGIAQGTDQD
jgi:hypothetical protein